MVTAVTVCALAIGASFARWYFPDTAYSLVQPHGLEASLSDQTVALNHDLFGRVPLARKTLKPTQLKLSLVGVLPSQDSSQGIAIIRSSNTPDTTYEVGAAILPDVTLAGVYEDYVVIDRAGQMESLFLENTPEAGSNVALLAPVSSSHFESISDNSKTDLVTAAKVVDEKMWRKTYQEFIERPHAVLDDLGVTLTSEGYQLNQGSALTQYGLQPNDIVLSVNGMPLKQAKPNFEMMTASRNAKSLRVEVEREGKRFIINVPTQ